MSSSRRRKKNTWSIAGLIPQLSRPRWISLAVLAVTTLIIAYHAMAFSISMVTRKSNPDLALSFSANDPVALSTKADLLFLKSQDPKTLAEVERLARASIRAQALNPSAVRILGYVADARGETKKAKQLVLLAEKLSRREFGAQLWLIEDAAARDDIPEALRHYDIALRTTPESQLILFPTLNDALSLPSVRRGMASYVRQWPNWMTAYIFDAIGNVSNPANVADILLKGGGYPQTDENKGLADTLLRHLEVKAKFGAFQQYYNSLPGARVGSLTTAAMNMSSVNARYAAASWQLTDSAAIGGTFVKSGKGDGYSLQAFAGSGERGTVMTKLLFLSPGRYRLHAQYSIAESASDGQVRWDVNCPVAGGASNIGYVTTPILKGNSAAALDFVIGSDCRAQQVILQLAGGNSQIGAEIVLRSIAIQKLGAVN